MKRLKVILLLLLFVHSKMGMALNFHYCGDHIAAISLAYSPKGCGMEMTKNQKTEGLSFSQKSCCSDALEIFQSTEQLNTISFQQQTFFVSIGFEQINAFQDLVNFVSFYPKYRPPLVIKDIYKIDETYLI